MGRHQRAGVGTKRAAVARRRVQTNHSHPRGVCGVRVGLSPLHSAFHATRFSGMKETEKIYTLVRDNIPCACGARCSLVAGSFGKMMAGCIGAVMPAETASYSGWSDLIWSRPANTLRPTNSDPIPTWMWESVPLSGLCRSGKAYCEPASGPRSTALEDDDLHPACNEIAPAAPSFVPVPAGARGARL